MDCKIVRGALICAYLKVVFIVTANILKETGFSSDCE